jgi:hypothetical protein
LIYVARRRATAAVTSGRSQHMDSNRNLDLRKLGEDAESQTTELEHALETETGAALWTQDFAASGKLGKVAG